MVRGRQKLLRTTQEFTIVTSEITDPIEDQLSLMMASYLSAIKKDLVSVQVQMSSSITEERLEGLEPLALEVPHQR